MWIQVKILIILSHNSLFEYFFLLIINYLLIINLINYRSVSINFSVGRHSKSLDIEKKRCGHCYGKFELLVNKITKSGTVQVQTPKREPSAFALYVKENYNSVKKDKNLKHGEVMKLLGQQFSAIKIAKKDDNNVDNDKDSSD